MNHQDRFSLVEGLVLVLTLFILGLLTPPVFRKMVVDAGLVKCRSNLYTLGMGAHLYASEHEGNFPANFDSGTGRPVDLSGTYVGDGRMYGVLLSQKLGGHGDTNYIDTPYPLVCPSLSPEIYALNIGYKKPEEISEENPIIAMGYFWMYFISRSLSPNDTVYRDINLPLVFDFGWNWPRVGINYPSHSEMINVLHVGGHVTSVPLDLVRDLENIQTVYNELRNQSAIRSKNR